MVEQRVERRLAAILDADVAAHDAKSFVLIAQKCDEEALVEVERSLDLSPSYIPAYVTLCAANRYMGLPEKTIEIADRAIRLSPRDPELYSFYFEKGLAYEQLKEDAQYRRVVTMAPQWPNPQRLLVEELALNGQEAEAREVLQRYLSLKATRISTIAQFKASSWSLSRGAARVREDRAQM